MIIEGSDKKNIGNTGNTYYTVLVVCPECKIEREVDRNKIKKAKHYMCVKCYRKSPLFRELLSAGQRAAPSKLQIRCLCPCLYCGKDHPRTKNHLRKHPLVFCNAKCQNAWQNKYTDFNKGEKNPAYKNGSRVGGRLARYDSGFDSKTKRKVKIRDGFNCKKCNKNFSGNKSKLLDVHHIDEDKNNSSMDNLVCLCKSCHVKIHRHGETFNISQGG